MGPDAWLCPEQKVLLESDPAKARAVAREAMAVYLRAPNYQNNLKELGFDDSDLAAGGSDRLVDAIVAWGDEAALRDRIQEHLDAGATHVCIQPLKPDGGPGADLRALEALAPA
jgi:probable F420-dependent oxidoreductase